MHVSCPVCVEVRRQHVIVGPLLLLCGSWSQTQVVTLWGKGPDLLWHSPGPWWMVLKTGHSLMYCWVYTQAVAAFALPLLLWLLPSLPPFVSKPQATLLSCFLPALYSPSTGMSAGPVVLCVLFAWGCLYVAVCCWTSSAHPTHHGITSDAAGPLQYILPIRMSPLLLLDHFSTSYPSGYHLCLCAHCTTESNLTKVKFK